MIKIKDFLPINKKEMEKRGWSEVDFVCVTGDAYVDHPSFGIAIISRLLESMGFKVAILSQPNHKNVSSIKEFGRPKLGFMITSGNIDSMVLNYTAAGKRRSDDSYSAGNVATRPDRAVNVYSKMAKEAYPDCPVIIGGLEASLRRFAHYDYWTDSVLPSTLLQTGADILSYGMGEHQTREIASRLADGEDVKYITDVKGTCVFVENPESIPYRTITMPSFENVRDNKNDYLRAFKMQNDNQDFVYGKPLLQKHEGRYLIQNPPSPPLTTEEMDEIFELPYMRYYHPSYESKGGVKAIEEVEFSIMHNRGCFGYCNFCAIAGHQGRQIAVRSKESIIREAKGFLSNPRFKGYIHDVGGPTANFRAPSCKKQETEGMCKDRKCIGHKPCPALIVDHTEYLDILRSLRNIKGIKKVFVRSGLRFDYMLLDKNEEFFKELIEHHISGQLKVAPEHCSDNVLSSMGKPPVEAYNKFVKRFKELTKQAGKEQYIVPYLMSSHPGSTLKDALELSLFLKKNKMRPEQVQDFYPTPGSIATCMFHTGIDPTTNKEIYVPKTAEEKKKQRAMLQYFKPENRRVVIDTLIKVKREDLIGNTSEHLIAPDKEYLEYKAKKNANNKGQAAKGRYSNAKGKNSNIKGKGNRKNGKK